MMNNTTRATLTTALTEALREADRYRTLEQDSRATADQWARRAVEQERQAVELQQTLDRDL